MASNQTKEFRKSVADMFVKGLSEEGLNWKQGWATTGELRNAVSNRHYRGLNEFYLKLISMVNGYKDPRWMTFNQIRDEGYHLEKGSKGAKVEYWFPFDTIKKKGVSFEEKERLINEGKRKNEDFSLIAKYYTVFNGDNISGLPEIELPKNEIEPSKVLEQISKGMKVEIYNDGEDRAFYRPSTDDIHLPLPEVFSSDNEYNAVAFHELGHATGHESRLNRDQSGVFGTSAYAKEELVAEITSAFMAETNPWLKDTYECKGFIEADGYQEKKDGKVEDIYSPCVYKMEWDETEDTYKIPEEVGTFTRIPTYNEFKTMYNLSDDDYIALAKEVSGIEISSSPEELNKIGFNSKPDNKDYLNSIGDIYLKCIEEKGFVSVPERTYESFDTINASNVHIAYGDNELDIEVDKNTPIYVAFDTSLESTKGLEFIGSTSYEESVSCTLDNNACELFNSDLPDNPIGANFFRTENSELVIELISDDCSMKGFYPNNPFYKDNNIEKGELHNLYNKQVGTLKLAEMGENKSHTKASNLNKDLGSEI